tara:strand:+ start:246 stop:443 length:198 start_codon:yes stop_codon:yes gene_type:complete
MVRKKAIEIKKGEVIVLAGKQVTVEEVEHSDIGKQGSKKVRIVAKDDDDEMVTVIRPEGYPVEII